MSSTMKTPKRKASALSARTQRAGRRTSSGRRSRRSSGEIPTISAPTTGRRRSSSRRSSTHQPRTANVAAKHKRTASATPQNGRRETRSSTGSKRKRAKRRGSSDKWNVRADDPNLKLHEQAGAAVTTTQPPLSKSALKRKYTSSMVDEIDAEAEAEKLLSLPADRWDAIIQCLERLRALANVDPRAMQGHEACIFQALSKCVRAQRSAIPRHALNTMQAVIANLDANTFLESEMDGDEKEQTDGSVAAALVLLLLKISATHDKKFIKAAATRCIGESVNTMHGHQQFSMHFTQNAVLQNRSRNVIAAGVAGFQRCVEACAAEQLAMWDMDTLATGIHRICTARAANVRSTTKAITRLLFARLDSSVVLDVKAKVGSKPGITPRELNSLFVQQRLSARKKRKPLRPWSRRADRR